jgi:protein-S-isoprenylcysteine O-methyltransferase Ste14
MKAMLKMKKIDSHVSVSSLQVSSASYNRNGLEEQGMRDRKRSTAPRVIVQLLVFIVVVPFLPLLISWIILAGYLLASYALIENHYFSGMVHIQTDRGHRVVSSGPYRWMRHPGYAGALLTYLAAPLFLDALTAFVPAAPRRVLAGLWPGSLAALLVLFLVTGEMAIFRYTLRWLFDAEKGADESAGRSLCSRLQEKGNGPGVQGVRRPKSALRAGGPRVRSARWGVRRWFGCLGCWIIFRIRRD